MTITARAREIITQTNETVVQTVRFFNNAAIVNDAPVQYASGTDQAAAVANLTSVVKAAVARRAADGTTVAVVPGTLLDLTDPAPIPPTQAQLDQAAYFTAKRKAQGIKALLDLGSAHVTQQNLTDAVSAWNALTFDPAWEGL